MRIIPGTMQNQEQHQQIQQPHQNTQSFNEILSSSAKNRKSDISNEATFQKTAFIMSKHANFRLNERQIKLTPDQLSRLDQGITQAGQKGITDSLVLIDDVALVVNVKNRTVITAMDKENKSVFTNINGAVIV